MIIAISIEHFRLAYFGWEYVHQFDIYGAIEQVEQAFYGLPYLMRLYLTVALYFMYITVGKYNVKAGHWLLFAVCRMITAVLSM